MQAKRMADMARAALAANPPPIAPSTPPPSHHGLPPIPPSAGSGSPATPRAQRHYQNEHQTIEALMNALPNDFAELLTTVPERPSGNIQPLDRHPSKWKHLATVPFDTLPVWFEEQVCPSLVYVVKTVLEL